MVGTTNNDGCSSRTLESCHEFLSLIAKDSECSNRLLTNGQIRLKSASKEMSSGGQPRVACNCIAGSCYEFEFACIFE